jgi:hypothetical protein
LSNAKRLVGVEDDTNTVALPFQDAVALTVDVPLVLGVGEEESDTNAGDSVLVGVNINTGKAVADAESVGDILLAAVG